jgi:SAM-dependent methyltransferase
MRFEDFAQLYALEEDFWWFVGMREITASLLDPILAAGQDRRILDAGCGAGINLIWLKRYAGGGLVVGVDLDSGALDFCRARGHGELVQASTTALPFGDETFDLVTSFDVLVQLPGEGADERALAEMYRVLRPRGVCFVRAAAYSWLRSSHDEAIGSQRRYTLGGLAGRVHRAGFRVRRATYANTLLLPVAIARRLLLERIGIVSRGSEVRPLPPVLRRLNPALTEVLRVESRLTGRVGLKLPFGLSAICVAEKA